MAWDTTKPADSDPVKDYPTLARADKTQLKTTIEAEHQAITGATAGMHKFPVGAADPVGADLEGRIAIVGNRIKAYANGKWRYVGELTGEIREYSGDTLLDGWLWADGAAADRTTEADLYAIVADKYRADGSLSTRTGDTQGVITFAGGNRGLTTSETLDVYWAAGSRLGMSITNVAGALVTVSGGAGDVLPAQNTALSIVCASGKFFLPDRRGRVAVGKDSMGGTAANRVTDVEADSVGRFAGAEKKALVEAELAPHVHTIAHTHTMTHAHSGGGSLSLHAIPSFTDGDLSFSDYPTNASSAANSGSVGSSTPFTVMNPYEVCNYIVKK